MIKPSFPVLALLGSALLAACSNPEDTGRFLIDPPTAGVQVANRLGTAELKDVSLPEYAGDQEVAYQSPDGAVRSNPDNLWADSPSRAFTTTLARAIGEVSGATVIGEPWPLAQPPARRLEVRVERALAQADNSYRLSGRYFVSDDGLTGGGTNHARSFDIRVPMAAQGPGETAVALSQAISILAQQIATLSGPGATIATTQPATDEFGLPPLF
ncbi:membrane integrity-associated transporter subunit PqiC [Paracoccus liaowanqingii]|uniref:Membrane integrity-associated transporter subunit PqiC n=1 Tax=Paracoccus liaowanqingii TaxID=2560053 RepID=A0A4Z1C859_9RHOB|nr:PqiC family protein [Paracoccus liaowanqingii]TGN57855.1 membrane integrity-associated transporter subunit PqiC [Paracoccus liaowanqingii]